MQMWRQFYHKMQQLLQNAMILLWNAPVITKCDVYYKMRQCTYFEEHLCTAASEHETVIRTGIICKKIIS